MCEISWTVTGGLNALANALAHEEVLRNQAILLDDKHFLNRELYGDAAAGIIGGNTGLRKVGSFREDIVAVR